MNHNILTELLSSFIIITFLFSCTGIENRVHDNKSNYSVDLQGIDVSPSLNFDDAFLWSKSIPLTFGDETVIGEISKVVKSGEYFYVLDSKTHSLYEFDYLGV